MTTAHPNRKGNLNRSAQLIVVVLCAAAVKLYYSTASVNQLRWILAPTTFLVELVSGNQFEFESYAGYVKSDHSFVIAASCAGVNFLITAFLVLSLRRLWRDRSQEPPHNRSWMFIPVSAMFAYLGTLVANTVRISSALRLHGMSRVGRLTPAELHRLDGIVVYFSFLLLLFVISERFGENRSSSLKVRLSWGRNCLFPLGIYYLTTIGVPLINGGFRQGHGFWEHSLFVLLTPLVLLLPLVAWQRLKNEMHQAKIITVAASQAPKARNAIARGKALATPLESQPYIIKR